MKKIFLLLSLFSASVFAQNLVSMSSWTADGSQGSIAGFTSYGNAGENTRVLDDTPNGRAVVWKATSDGDSQNSGSYMTGGFFSDFVQINPTKTYRLSMWIKKNFSTTNQGHRSLFGLLIRFGTTSSTNIPPIIASTGLAASNSSQYFANADLPESNKWYLFVGYIQGNADNSTVIKSAIYDGTTGEFINPTSSSSSVDYRFPIPTNPSDPVRVSIRGLAQTSSTNVAPVGDSQWHYNPRIEEVNGNEPSISSLLGVRPQSAIIGNTISPAKIGVNTTNSLGEYELAVNGEIIAKEVNVNLTGPWPDYVFENDYNLKPIEEIETYIKSNKHLPEVPSAEEVCKEGIFLGDMNAKLLKKIEELTLYLIEQNKQINTLQVEVEELKKK